MKTKQHISVAAGIGGIVRAGAVALVTCFSALAAEARTDAITCTISPERAVLQSGKPESAVVKVAMKGGKASGEKERPSVNLAIVLDRSGSMSGDKIIKAREAAIEAVGKLDERDIVSIVIFDHEIETIVSAQSAENRPDIISKIRRVEARGNTAIFGGVSQGANEIRKNLDKGMINRIILLSDGLANVGPSSPHELGRLGVSLMKEGVSVSTVGLGLGYNEDLMTSLAGKSDGNSYFVENSEDLPRIFSAELGEVLSVVAKKVRLAVSFKNGAHPVELIGRDGRIDGDTVYVDLNQIYSNQEKFLLIRTEFSVGEDGESRDFARAEVTYELPDDGSRQVAIAKGNVRFSSDSLIVEESVDKDVMTDSLLNITAVESERAVRLIDEGKHEEARQVIKMNIDRADEVGKKYDIPAASMVADEQLELSREAGDAKAKGAALPSRSRKVFMQRSYKVINQQSPSEK